MRRYLTVFSLVSLAALAGCSTPAVTEFASPDGSKIKTVKCVSDAQKCFASAAQSCPGEGTYRVVSSESHAGGIFADVLPGPVTWYGMTYACGPSDGKMPEFRLQGQQYTPPAYTPPAPAPARRATTTTCNRMGTGVTCNSY